MSSHLLNEFCFLYIFEMLPRTGFYRLPTHIRSAHRKLFSMNPSYFKIKIFAKFPPWTTHAPKVYEDEFKKITVCS